MPTITVDCFGFSGTGPTVKEAKQDAGRKIQALHTGYFTPKLRHWRGYTAIAYRDLQGWNTVFVQHPEDVEPHLHGGGCCGYENEREAIRSMERHIADMGWNHGDPLDTFPVWLGTADNKEHADMRRELIAARKWQLQMQHLIHTCKIQDEDARRMIAGLLPVPDGVQLLTF